MSYGRDTCRRSRAGSADRVAAPAAPSSCPEIGGKYYHIGSPGALPRAGASPLAARASLPYSCGCRNAIRHEPLKVSDPAVSTFLFTDIEGSTRLWEQEPARMADALARHDALARSTVAAHRGEFIKTTGDGIHAVFGDPLDALRAAVGFQLALADPAATGGVPLCVRSGMHAGVDARRDNDFFGTAVNRAARVMAAAHGGQILVSQTVEALIRGRLPPDVNLRDLGAVRLRGLAQSERVFQVVHPILRQEFPALRMLESTPHNLPQPLTSFVGREHELAEGKRQLQNTRLLTLLGIGGLGKSRLSLAIAADVLDEYADGVWFVELAPVTDARLVPQAVAAVLGVKEEAGRPVREALAQFVRDRQLMVVLDNCEHLAHACAELARELLEAGPRVKILTSSRERLNIRGEKVYALAPLAVASPQQKLTPDSIIQFPAVRLFVERAVAANSEFRVTPENAAAVVEICHRLDGIPLALELAAARVRALSVNSIAERLVDRFRLLRGGDRTALPRQQTLRALIDWSYDLLAPQEQVLFRRLAVFAGGFTLEAAEKIATADDIDDADVLDLLSQLIEKSLVTVDSEADRYGMLETVREYAQHRLEDAGDFAASRERHLDYFLHYAEMVSPHTLGPEQARWLTCLDHERENIAAAHAWCGESPKGGDADLRLVRAIRGYCFKRGLLAMGLAATLDALGRAGAQERSFARCRALSDAGQLAMRSGKHQEALRYLEESLAIARELGDKARIEAVLQPLAMARLAAGDLPAAQAHLEEALGLARELGDKGEIAAALSVLTQVHRVAGAYTAAAVVCDQSLALARELRDRVSIAVTLLNRVMIMLQQATEDPVAGMLAEAHDIIAESGATMIAQCLLDVAAGLAAAHRDWSRAARYFGAADALATQLGVQRDGADEAFLRPFVDASRDALGPAEFARHEGEGRGLAYRDAMSEFRAWLGTLAGDS
jgi:predicted ATPase/class 3 adenylate cyclase